MGITTYLYTIIGYRISYDVMEELFKKNQKIGFDSKVFDEFDELNEIVVYSNAFSIISSSNKIKRKYNVVRVKNEFNNDLYISIHNSEYYDGSMYSGIPSSQKLNDLDEFKILMEKYFEKYKIDSYEFGVFYEVEQC